MSLSRDALKSLALQASLSPQEEMLETSQKYQNLYIGIPKETELQEQRVALVPEKTLIFRILITVSLVLKLYTTLSKYIRQI